MRKGIDAFANTTTGSVAGNYQRERKPNISGLTQT